MLSGKPLEKVDVIAKVGNWYSSDPIEIHNIELDANMMYMNISWNGSCYEHEQFDFIGLEEINIDFEPPVRTVKLLLKHVEDTCTMRKDQTIGVNIRELTVVKSQDIETDLNIMGWRKKIRYVYVE